MKADAGMDKSKDELIKEIESMQERVDDLVRLLSAHEDVESELHELRCILKERVKEISCLRSISRLRDKPGISSDELIQGIVDLIPPAWQYPE